MASCLKDTPTGNDFDAPGVSTIKVPIFEVDRSESNFEIVSHKKNLIENKKDNRQFGNLQVQQNSNVVNYEISKSGLNSDKDNSNSNIKQNTIQPSIVTNKSKAEEFQIQGRDTSTYSSQNNVVDESKSVPIASFTIQKEKSKEKVNKIEVKNNNEVINQINITDKSNFENKDFTKILKESKTIKTQETHKSDKKVIEEPLVTDPKQAQYAPENVFNNPSEPVIVDPESESNKYDKMSSSKFFNQNESIKENSEKANSIVQPTIPIISQPVVSSLDKDISNSTLKDSEGNLSGKKSIFAKGSTMSKEEDDSQINNDAKKSEKKFFQKKDSSQAQPVIDSNSNVQGVKDNVSLPMETKSKVNDKEDSIPKGKADEVTNVKDEISEPLKPIKEIKDANLKYQDGSKDLKYKKPEETKVINVESKVKEITSSKLTNDKLLNENKKSENTLNKEMIKPNQAFSRDSDNTYFNTKFTNNINFSSKPSQQIDNLTSNSSTSKNAKPITEQKPLTDNTLISNNNLNYNNNGSKQETQPSSLEDMLNMKINKQNNNNKFSGAENNYIDDKDKQLNIDTRFKQFQPYELNSLKFKERNDTDFFNETNTSKNNVFEKIKKIDPLKKNENEEDPFAKEFNLLMEQNKNSLKDYREMLLKVKKDNREDRANEEKNKQLSEKDKQRLELRMRLAEKLKSGNN